MPVIPEWLEPEVELVPLDWRPIVVAAGHVAMDALYRARHETYELTIAARERDSDALLRQAEEMRVWFHPLDEPPGPPPPEPLLDLPTMLEMIASEETDGPAVAVHIAYRPRPFVFRIDPTINVNAAQGYNGVGTVEVVVTRGQVRVSGLNPPVRAIFVGVMQPRGTSGRITVKGVANPSSDYQVNGSSTWTPGP